MSKEQAQRQETKKMKSQIIKYTVLASALIFSGSTIAADVNDEHELLMFYCGDIIKTHMTDWGFTEEELDGKHDLELYCHLHKHEDEIKKDSTHHGDICFLELKDWVENHPDLPKKNGEIDCSGVMQHT